MSKQQNNCSNLDLDYKEADQFDEIFNYQRSFQKKLHMDFGSPDKTIKEISEFFLVNKHALEDELSEMMDALGGINDGIGNAGWKYWKKDHQKAHTMKLSDLSESDLMELKYEVVDIFHFFMNFALAVGMTGSELYSMYLAKNKENIDRQNRGY